MEGICDICGRVAYLQTCNLCGKRVCPGCLKDEGICVSCRRGRFLK